MVKGFFSLWITTTLHWSRDLRAQPECGPKNNGPNMRWDDLKEGHQCLYFLVHTQREHLHQRERQYSLHLTGNSQITMPWGTVLDRTDFPMSPPIEGELGEGQTQHLDIEESYRFVIFSYVNIWKPALINIMLFHLGPVHVCLARGTVEYPSNIIYFF